MSDRISESEDFANAFDADPKATTVFLMMLPQADCYGILSGKIKVLRGRVCPLLGLSDAKFEAVLSTLDGPMIERYTDSSGQPLIWIRKYHEHQDVNWERVGEPDHELPPDWTIPKELIAAVKKPKDPRKRTASDSLREWFSEYAEKRGLRLSLTVTDSQGLSPLEVDTDTDVDTDTEELPCAPPADAEAAQEVEKPKDKPGPANTPLAQLVQDTWEALGFAGSPPSKKPAAFSGAIRLIDGKADTVRDELILWIKRKHPRPGHGDTEAKWFLSFLEEKLKCTPGVGWRLEVAEWLGGNGPEKPLLRGWPSDLTEPRLTRRFTREEVDAMIRSPDWDRFPDLDKYLSAQTVNRIREAREAWLAEQG